MRFARKSDANQPEIVRALRKVGCSVLIMKNLGGGYPDIAAARGRRTVLFEIKNRAARGKPNELQRAFAATWQGECYTVGTAAEAVAVMLRV